MVFDFYHFLLSSQVKLLVWHLLPRGNELLHRLLKILQTGELQSSPYLCFRDAPFDHWDKLTHIENKNTSNCLIKKTTYCAVNYHSAQISRLLKNDSSYNWLCAFQRITSTGLKKKINRKTKAIEARWKQLDNKHGEMIWAVSAALPSQCLGMLHKLPA